MKELVEILFALLNEHRRYWDEETIYSVINRLRLKRKYDLYLMKTADDINVYLGDDKIATFTIAEKPYRDYYLRWIYVDKY